MNEGLMWDLYTTFYIDNQFVVSGGMQGDFEGIYVSEDGVSWTSVSTTSAPDLQWIPSLKLFVGSGTDYNLIMSPQLQGPWTSTPAPTGINSWAYGNGIFMIQDDDPQWAWSTGSIYALTYGDSTWTEVWSSTGPGCPPCRLETILSNIVFNSLDNQFYVQNYINGTIMTSADGKEWDSLTTLPANCEFTEGFIDSGSDIYLVCGEGFENNYFISTGNNQWQQINGNAGSWFGSIDYLSEIETSVAAGANGTVWYSKDGINFTPGETLYDTTDQIDFYSFAASSDTIIALGGFSYVGFGDMIYTASVN